MLRTDRIREQRLRLDMSQETLGKAVGQAGNYISQLERGVRTNCTAVTLEGLATTLHCSADYLLGLSDTPQCHGKPRTVEPQSTLV